MHCWRNEGNRQNETLGTTLFTEAVHPSKALRLAFLMSALQPS